jgi:hypothetical protein
MRRIAIKESDYLDILKGTTGNGIADMIPAILEQKRSEGYEVVVLDDFTGEIVSRLG